MAGRIYSGVSNFAIGRFVRAIVFFLVGFVLTIIFLPRTGLVHTETDLKIAAVIVGILLSLLARRYT